MLQCCGGVLGQAFVLVLHDFATLPAWSQVFTYLLPFVVCCSYGLCLLSYWSWKSLLCTYNLANGLVVCICRCPFYYHVKFVFLVWLQMPGNCVCLAHPAISNFHSWSNSLPNQNFGESSNVFMIHNLGSKWKRFCIHLCVPLTPVDCEAGICSWCIVCGLWKGRPFQQLNVIMQDGLRSNCFPATVVVIVVCTQLPQVSNKCVPCSGSTANIQ